MPESHEEDGHPVKAKAKWQRDLVRDVGDCLFALVKDGTDRRTGGSLPESQWRSSAMDPRFTNLNHLDEDEIRALARASDGTQHRFDYFMNQVLSRYDQECFDPQKRVALGGLRATRDAKALLEFTRSEPRVRGSEQGPRDMMLFT